MKLDRYDTYARLFPAIISAIPLILFLSTYGPTSIFGQSVGNIFYLKIVGNVSILSVFIFLLFQINRLISKFIIEKWLFKNEQLFPTTEMLNNNDNRLSVEYKKKIFKKVMDDFGIDLISQNNNKQIIIEAVGLIRTIVGAGRVTLIKNIEYGFFRNLIGGSYFGLIVSILSSFYFYNTSRRGALLLSCVLGGMYFLIIIFSKIIIKTIALDYAKNLYREYLSQ